MMGDMICVCVCVYTVTTTGLPPPACDPESPRRCHACGECDSGGMLSVLLSSRSVRLRAHHDDCRKKKTERVVVNVFVCVQQHPRFPAGLMLIHMRGRGALFGSSPLRPSSVCVGRGHKRTGGVCVSGIILFSQSLSLSVSLSRSVPFRLAGALFAHVCFKGKFFCPPKKKKNRA